MKKPLGCFATFAGTLGAFSVLRLWLSTFAAYLDFRRLTTFDFGGATFDFRPTFKKIFARDFRYDFRLSTFAQTRTDWRSLAVWR